MENLFTKCIYDLEKQRVNAIHIINMVVEVKEQNMNKDITCLRVERKRYETGRIYE